jgi:hypothetical protein
MAGSLVVSALVDKRAEIAGRIRQMEQQVGQFRAIRPLRAPELVVAVMAAKGFDPADRPSFIKVQWKVGATLRRLAKCRLRVAARRPQHGAVVWQIADHAA